MNPRNLLIGFTFILLLASIPVGVALIKQQVILTSQAKLGVGTHIEITGGDVSDLRTKSSHVKIKVFYSPGKDNVYPSEFRLSNQLAILDQVPGVPFAQNNQEVDWQLEQIPGPRSVYAQFKVQDIWQQPISASIILDNP